MECPMFVDYVRECLDKIDFVPRDTFDYCQTDKFKDCPFFKTINNVGPHCECLVKCPAYKNFNIGDFDRFVEIANRYCLSENNVNCERLKLRKSGKEVPEDLMPDGTRLSE